MEELRRLYRAALPGRIQALEAAGARPFEAESAETIRRIAHSLRGSGATYGFPAITSLAQLVEEAPEPEVMGRLADLLDELRQVAAGNEDATTVLIVEDQPELVLLLSATLEAEERTLSVAETAAAARHLLAAGRPDLVILDLLLPDGDGRSLLMGIREAVHTADVPVIVLSARTGGRAKAECFALGADGFFEKPFDPEALQAAVASLLRRAGRRERASLVDPATGLANRAGLATALADARQAGGPVALAVLRPSDAAALATDELLRETAGRLGDLLDDPLAYLGEGHFVVTFRDRDVDPARELLEGALAALAGDGPEMRAGLTTVAADADLEDALAAAGALVHTARRLERRRVAVAADKERRQAARILLVEDDELAAAIVLHRLQREGFDVHHVTDGLTAIERAGELMPDLVILDVKIPGIDGFEVLSRLRANTALKGVPIMMLTSMGNEAHVVQAFELGADDYILKPFSPVEVLARVTRLLGRR